METLEARKEAFIKKANEKHNNKYDYSKVDFVNSQTKVTIVCPLHGEFYQPPAVHTYGARCAKCAKIATSNNQKLTMVRFLERATERHGDKYNYDKVVFDNNRSKITIGCKIHGDFIMTLSNHLNGQGCKECGKLTVSRKMQGNTRGTGTRAPRVNMDTLDKFLKKAHDTHGDKFDYTNLDYHTSISNIILVCPTHGVFTTTPNIHISSKGGGCNKCSILARNSSLRMTLSTIQNRIEEAHGTRYTYNNLSQELGTKSYLDITCKIHGNFTQRLDIHLDGHGCPLCSITHRTKTIESYIAEAKKIHGDKYDYSNLVYDTAHKYLTIRCPTHGDFTVQNKEHVRKRTITSTGAIRGGVGCPKCSASGNERVIINYLDNNNIEYSFQYKLPRSNYRYDFHITKLNILIEYDGEQHYKTVDLWGGAERLKLIQEDDIAKTKLALLNNVPLLRIKYDSIDILKELTEFIKKHSNK